MFLLRILVVLAIIVIGSSLFAWLMTRDSRYLTLARRVGAGTLAIALFILLLFMAERLLTL